MKRNEEGCHTIPGALKIWCQMGFDINALPVILDSSGKSECRWYSGEADTD